MIWEAEANEAQAGATNRAPEFGKVWVGVF